MDQLKNYDKDNIPKKRIKKINGKICKESKFTVEAIAKSKQLQVTMYVDMYIYDRVAGLSSKKITCKNERRA